MKTGRQPYSTGLALVIGMVALGGSPGRAEDWTQWRGSERAARVGDFKAPATWPRELKQAWKVTVGDGVATPALLGDRLYVFSPQEGSEVLRCLSASDGKELWQEKYETSGATGAAQGFSGPRSSPAVGNGKVVTLGVRGMLSCVDASTGALLWRKDDFKAWPDFHAASSPLIVDRVVVAQLGGRTNGALVAYDLATGEQKWKWSGPSPAYASPMFMVVGGTKLIVAQTERTLVAVHAADGRLAWEDAPAPQPGGDRDPAAARREPGAGPGGGAPGRGSRGGPRDYRAATPIVEGETIIIAGRGIKAVKLEKQGDKLAGTELWSSADKSVQFSSPVLKKGLIYGLTANNELFCLNAKDGKTLWSAPFPAGASTNRPTTAAESDSAARPRGPGGPGRGGRGGGFGGGFGGGAGYGSIVDAGSVMLALTPASQLIVFEPGEKEYKQLASYKVADSPTHAYPIPTRNRVFIKDRDSVTLWTLD